MDTKLPLYQWLVALLPGTISLAIVIALLKLFSIPLPALPIASQTLRVFIFLIGGLIIGELLQALSSILEPAITKSWGGKPSRVLLKGEKHKYELKMLKSHFGEDLSNEELFERAMAVCNQSSLGRSEYFNILYAYTRSLFVNALVFTIFTLALMIYRHDYRAILWWLLLGEILVTLLLWYRTKQRGFSFAKEVIVQSSLSLTKK